MTLVNGSPSVILKNVSRLIKKNVPKDTADLVEQFSTLLYGNISSLDLSNRNDSDMYGATLSLWSTLNEHPDDTPIIHVFNPSVSTNGWKSSHTIIEIIVKVLLWRPIKAPQLSLILLTVFLMNINFG